MYSISPESLDSAWSMETLLFMAVRVEDGSWDVPQRSSAGKAGPDREVKAENMS